MVRKKVGLGVTYVDPSLLTHTKEANMKTWRQMELLLRFILVLGYIKKILSFARIHKVGGCFLAL